MPSPSSPNPDKHSDLLCFSHRGSKENPYTENSLGAFAHSITLGCDAIELDVWQIEDELLVYHDRLLNKYFPKLGHIKQYSVEFLRQLQLPCGSQIPTLAEVLTLVGNQLQINIELKDPEATERVCELLQTLSKGLNIGTEHYLLSSFNQPQLMECARLAPTIRRGVLLEGIPLDYAACATAIGAFSIHPSINFIDQALVDDAHQRGLQVYVYTVNTPEDIAWMERLGVDGIFTDYPSLLLK